MERRREALRQADASNRIEGVFRKPETDPIFEAFIRGEIEVEEIHPRLKALNNHPLMIRLAPTKAYRAHERHSEEPEPPSASP
ncbi:MAG: hypothetical protein WDN69_22940 [Aliidongia sp.]